MSEMEIDGTDVRLVARRRGHGVPLVFVNGTFGGLDSWDPVLDALGDGFEAWTYARRGYPPSGVPHRENTFADDVADLAAVLARVGRRPHLVGGSHGATVALHAVRTRAVDVESLTIFEPALYAAGETLRDTLARFRARLDAGGRGAARLFLAEVARMPQEFLPPHGADVDPALLRGAQCDLEAMVADTTDVQRWAAIDVPTLLLQGEQTWDPMPATMAALFAALPPGTRRVEFTGRNHFVTHEAPDEFAAALRGFVAPG